MVGGAVGAVVGSAVGAAVGVAVGATVGAAVGGNVGAIVGTTVGGEVGAIVGASVGTSVAVKLITLGRCNSKQVNFFFSSICFFFLRGLFILTSWIVTICIGGLDVMDKYPRS
jgi:large-conductance mechanosensitive channel